MQIKVINEYNYPQRSDEWFNVRRGKITGSRFGELMTQGRGKDKIWGDTALSILKEKACEILTGIVEQIPPNYAMQWGIDHEAQALDVFELCTGLSVRECGFFEIDDNSGASPDGIVSNGKVFESKCPSSKVHFGYWLDKDELIKKYKWQVNGEMLATGADGAYLVSFDPRFDPSHQLVIAEIERNEEEIQQLAERIQLGAEMIKGWIA